MFKLLFYFLKQAILYSNSIVDKALDVVEKNSLEVKVRIFIRFVVP